MISSMKTQATSPCKDSVSCVEAKSIKRSQSFQSRRRFHCMLPAEGTHNMSQSAREVLSNSLQDQARSFRQSLPTRCTIQCLQARCTIQSLQARCTIQCLQARCTIQSLPTRCTRQSLQARCTMQSSSQMHQVKSSSQKHQAQSSSQREAPGKFFKLKAAGTVLSQKHQAAGITLVAPWTYPGPAAASILHWSLLKNTFQIGKPLKDTLGTKLQLALTSNHFHDPEVPLDVGKYQNVIPTIFCCVYKV